MTTSTIIIGAITLAGMSLLASDDLLSVPTTPTALAIGAMAVFGSVLAYIWWNQGIAKIGATR
ncbi:EamA family transporter, partial [Acinetobacter baumannii]